MSDLSRASRTIYALGYAQGAAAAARYLREAPSAEPGLDVVAPTLGSDAAAVGEHGPVGADRAYWAGVRSGCYAVTMPAAVGQPWRERGLAEGFHRADVWARTVGLVVLDE